MGAGGPDFKPVNPGGQWAWEENLPEMGGRLGLGPGTRTAGLVVAQLALLYATLPYVFDRATSGSRWPATVLFFRASQDKVFLPQSAMHW